MAVSNALGIRGDPLMSYNFVVSLLETQSGPLTLAKDIALGVLFDVLLGGFNECSGLEMSLDMHEYEEGGQHGYVHRFPTRVKWSNITLRKGIGAGTGLWDWHYEFVEGKGKRRDGVIVLLNDIMLPNNIWYFRRGLPVRYSGPGMNAQESRVAIEAIEIAHEGIWQVPYVGYANAAVSFGVNKVVTALT
ncbi:MAG TPA: phage tail protein [Longimicrobiaceae bacterium]|nr:phage tail protein [Longimicrobiaceae bacterium]